MLIWNIQQLDSVPGCHHLGARSAVNGMSVLVDRLGVMRYAVMNVIMSSLVDPGLAYTKHRIIRLILACDCIVYFVVNA